MKSLTNDILAEKISFEKVKSEETEQMKNLRKLEQERDAVQKVSLAPPRWIGSSHPY